MCKSHYRYFLQQVVCDQGMNGVRHKRRRVQYFGKGEVEQKGKLQNLGHDWGEPFPVSLSYKSWPPLKVHPEECAWSDYFNNFENSKAEYFFSKQQICKVKDGIEVAKSLVPNLCKIIKVSSS